MVVITEFIEPPRDVEKPPRVEEPKELPRDVEDPIIENFNLAVEAFNSQRIDDAKKYAQIACLHPLTHELYQHIQTFTPEKRVVYTHVRFRLLAQLIGGMVGTNIQTYAVDVSGDPLDKDILKTIIQPTRWVKCVLKSKELSSCLWQIANLLAFATRYSIKPIIDFGICDPIVATCDNLAYFIRDFEKFTLQHINSLPVMNVEQSQGKDDVYEKLDLPEGIMLSNFVLKGGYKNENFFTDVKTQIRAAFTPPKELLDLVKQTFNISTNAFYVIEDDAIDSADGVVFVTDAITSYIANTNEGTELQRISIKASQLVSVPQIEILALVMSCPLGGIFSKSSPLADIVWWGNWLNPSTRKSVNIF